MKQKNLYGLFFALCCLAAASVSAQSSSGSLFLNKGQKLQLDNTVKTVVTLDMMGQTMEINSDATSTKQVEVKEKKAASYIISATTTRLTTNGSAMGQSFSFDSDKKEDTDSSEAGKLLRGQVNVPKEVELNREGIVINAIKDTAASAEGGNPIMDIMKSMGSAKEDASGAADAFQVLPKGKKSGDTWMDSSISEGFKTYRTYIVKELKGKEATVTFTGTQQTSKVMESQGMEVTINMEAKLSGESVVDVSTGIVKQKTITIDGTGSADVMGQSVPMSTKITSTTTVKSL